MLDVRSQEIDITSEREREKHSEDDKSVLECRASAENCNSGAARRSLISDLTAEFQMQAGERGGDK